MSLADYTIAYNVAGFGTTPQPQTFANLGVTAARVVTSANGQDYAEITVDVSVTAPGMPFLPLQRHDLYAPGITNPVFSGWLLQPARAATNNRQQQTFRLDGPMSQLANIVYRQPWNFAIDPTNYNSSVTPTLISRVILNLLDPAQQIRLNVAAQTQAILDYAISNGASLAYAGLQNIPACQPPEDEQSDTYCSDLIARQMRWVPKVAYYWSYPGFASLGASNVPTLNFSANDAVPRPVVIAGGTGALPPGAAFLYDPAVSGVLIDVQNSALNSFKSQARYDLLVGKVTVDYQQEREVTSDGSPSGTLRVWSLQSRDQSTFANGSAREMAYSFDLRGAGGERDPATGAAETPQEGPPVGLAAALHDPFKVLTHGLEWSLIAADVDWSIPPGTAVGVINAGDDALAGSRSIIQQVTRELGTGTTTFKAGPPASLGLSDLTALTRFNRTRNAARNGASGGGGYSKGGGPDQKNTGKKLPSGNRGGSGGYGGAGSGSALPAQWWMVAVNGTVKYSQFNSSPPVDAPDGTVANPF